MSGSEIWTFQKSGHSLITHHSWVVSLLRSSNHKVHLRSLRQQSCGFAKLKIISYPLPPIQTLVSILI